LLSQGKELFLDIQKVFTNISTSKLTSVASGGDNAQTDQSVLERGRMQISVTVQRENAANRGFSPQYVQAQVGDSIFWRNADRNTLHQPYLVTVGDWAANRIQPGETSTQVNADTAGTFHYRCALHPDETGVLMVCTPSIIGPVGDGTSAFSMPSSSITAGTSVSFGNADSKQHWPMPQGGVKTAWFQSAIDPGDLSAPVGFDVVEDLTYQCALHPTETGPLQVNAVTLTIDIPASPAPASPEFLQIVLNQTVTFQNSDTSPHQPAPDAGANNAWFPSPIAPGQPGNVTFTKPGTYWYHDALSPNIKGIIQVGQK